MKFSKPKYVVLTLPDGEPKHRLLFNFRNQNFEWKPIHSFELNHFFFPIHFEAFAATPAVCNNLESNLKTMLLAIIYFILTIY